MVNFHIVDGPVGFCKRLRVVLDIVFAGIGFRSAPSVIVPGAFRPVATEGGIEDLQIWKSIWLVQNYIKILTCDGWQLERTIRCFWKNLSNSHPVKCAIGLAQADGSGCSLLISEGIW